MPIKCRRLLQCRKGFKVASQRAKDPQKEKRFRGEQSHREYQYINKNKKKSKD